MTNDGQMMDKLDENEHDTIQSNYSGDLTSDGI